MTNPNPVAPKTDTPVTEDFGCPRCSIGTAIFGDSCIVCVHIPDAIAGLIKEIQSKRAQVESTLAAERASLAAMTEDRNLWKGEHDGDCPNKAALMAERASRVQADTEQFNAGIEAASEYCMQLGLLPGTKEGTQTVRNVAFGIRALMKPSVSPEQAEEK